MAAVKFVPVSGRQETLEIRFGGRIFTFLPNVPQHVGKGDQAGVIAAIQATGATASTTNAEI